MEGQQHEIMSRELFRKSGSFTDGDVNECHGTRLLSAHLWLAKDCHRQKVVEAWRRAGLEETLFHQEGKFGGNLLV